MMGGSGVEVLSRPNARLHRVTPGVQKLVAAKKQDKEAATDTPHLHRRVAFSTPGL
jgi:hypothetical protein